MNCVLCALRMRLDAAAAYTLAGLSLCRKCCDRVADDLVNDVSVREILRQAVTGRW